MQKESGECARILLSAGFNPGLKNKEGKSPIDYAFAEKNAMA